MSIVFPMIPGVEINLFLIILLSLSIGVISGFVGIGGGCLMTPALIILGFPAHYAVGTSLAWVMGNSVIGTFRHMQYENVDMKLGLIMTPASILGVEIGVRLLNYVKHMGVAEVTVLMVTIAVLLTIGGYSFWESCKSMVQIRDGEIETSNYANIIFSKFNQIKLKPIIYFAKSRIAISLWIILGIGLLTGTISGLMGVGGGFMIVPSLIYIVGLPSFTAGGTSLFQFIFSAAYASIRHTMSGNVIIYASFIMILSSVIGIQFGVLGTRVLRGICMRFILSFSILVAILGSILKLIDIFSGSTIYWLQLLEIVITFGGLGLIVVAIVSLSAISFRFTRGKSIPKWLDAIVVKKTNNLMS